MHDLKGLTPQPDRSRSNTRKNRPAKRKKTKSIIVVVSGGERVFAARGKGLWCRPSNREHPPSVPKFRIFAPQMPPLQSTARGGRPPSPLPPPLVVVSEMRDCVGLVTALQVRHNVSLLERRADGSSDVRPAGGVDRRRSQQGTTGRLPRRRLTALSERHPPPVRLA